MQPESRFGPPSRWPRRDLVAASAELTPELALEGYRSGVFPMPLAPGERAAGAGRGLVGWFSPLRRGVLPLGGLRVTRSLRKVLGRYEVRTDTDFPAVLAGCADPSRPGGWIDDAVREVYGALFADGHVHTVEAWTPAGELAGGLYGVAVGGLFAGESMFHRPDVGRDASKVALVALVEVLRAAGGADRLLDVQWATPHLGTLGVVEVTRAEYLRRLHRALPLEPPGWPARP